MQLSRKAASRCMNSEGSWWSLQSICEAVPCAGEAESPIYSSRGLTSDRESRLKAFRHEMPLFAPVMPTSPT